MLKSILEILMERDGLEKDEAQELISECKQELYARLDNGEMPYDICAEFFGLEPDYLDQLLD